MQLTKQTSHVNQLHDYIKTISTLFIVTEAGADQTGEQTCNEDASLKIGPIVQFSCGYLYETLIDIDTEDAVLVLLYHVECFTQMNSSTGFSNTEMWSSLSNASSKLVLPG